MATIIGFDAETSSTVDLPRLGADVYTRDPNTRCLMFVYHQTNSNQPYRLWLEGQPPPTDFLDYAQNGCSFSGWNVVGFDRNVYNRILVPRHGFPPIDDDRWLDSMHLAAHANLPRSLAGAGRAVGIPFQENLKDSNWLRRITNANRTPIPAPVTTIMAEPEKFDRKLVDDLHWLIQRCLQDVPMEEQILARLPPWPTTEPWLAMPTIDRQINDRGVFIDVPLVQGLAKAAALELHRSDGVMAKVTDGQVKKCTEVEKLKTWLVGNGVELPPNEPPKDEDEEREDDQNDKETEKDRKSPWRLRKSDLADLLAKTDIPDKCHEALALRAEAAKVSVHKLRAMLRRVASDGRIYQAFSLGGAQATMRWSSGGVQLQNYVRDTYANFEEIATINGLDAKRDKEEVGRLRDIALDTAIQVGRTGDPELMRCIYQMQKIDLQGRSYTQGVLLWISRMLRSTLCVPEGHMLLNGDYSNIEARIPVWLAGQEDVVGQFARGEDVYRHRAAPIYGKPPEALSREERQIGKVVTLFCIEEGSLVLTDQGLVPIEKVTVDMLLWDGVEWVSHSGAVFNGYRDTVTYQGLTATPDHHVWVEGQSLSMELGEAAASHKNLVRSGVNEQEIRVCGNYQWPKTRSNSRQLVCTDCLPSLSSDSVGISIKSKNGSNKWLLSLFASAHSARKFKACLSRSKGSLRKLMAQSLCKLRRAGDSFLFSVGQGSRLMDTREHWPESRRNGVRQRRQQQALRAWEFAVGNAQRKWQQYSSISICVFQGQENTVQSCYTCNSVSSSVLSICRQYAQTFIRRARFSGRCDSTGRQTSAVSETKRPVWDILNAGPRHRFTVSGKLVSNCGFGAGPRAFVPAAMNYGITVSLDAGAQIIKTFRDTNTALVRFWDANLRCALEAIRDPGREFPVPPKGLVSWKCINNCLMCRLPSGRILRYRGAHLAQGTWPDGRPKAQPDIRVLVVKGKVELPRTLWRGLACLSAQSKVITRQGVKNLIDVSPNDELWDGIAWVKHDGVVYQGIKETISFGGVRMTPDHKVDIDGKWRECGNATHSDVVASYARHYQSPNWDASSNQTDWSQCTRESYLVDTLRLWQRKTNAVETVFMRWRSIMRMYLERTPKRPEARTSNPWDVETPGIRSMAFNERSMSVVDAPSVEKLWRPGDYGLSRMARKFRNILARYGTDVSNWINDRTARQQSQLQFRQLLLGYPFGAKQQSAQQCLYLDPLGRTDSCSSSSQKWYRGDNLVVPVSYELSVKAAIRQTRYKESVFDILNAGPRRRFTVIGDDNKLILVSNCENLTQAIAADMLGIALANMERAGLPVVLHCHDSLAAEVRAEQAERLLPRFKEAMLEMPAWTDGLPVAAEVHYGARFA